MMQRSSWFRFSTPSLVLIPVAVGINYIGKLFAGTLKLPLWLEVLWDWIFFIAAISGLGPAA